ncbi:MAG: IS110 family transposase [Alphaproteobacteria bacterium]|nr:MAG: IS110 family transposase [Alphaproteobacteria bacterium]
MTETTIGIDISKHHLDVHRLPGGQSARFSNDKAGTKQLILWLGAGVRRIVYEPTGRYHLALERRLDERDYPLVKVNPWQAKRFGEALGKRAKTDKIDAATLARMGAALALEPQPVRPGILRDLNEMVMARLALVKDRTAAKNRAKGPTLALLRRQNAARLRRIEADLEELDAAIQALIEKDEALRARQAILLSMPGISTLTAAALLAQMPELGALDHSAAASLAGLAPVTRQSGQWRGKAHILGGRALVREALYMPALVAARFNPDLKDFYTRLINAGKPPKVAVTAVMRKLIILANALLRDERKWTENQA